MTAVIASRLDLHDSLCILRVRPLDRPVPVFVPGQFTNLGLFEPGAADGSPPALRRAFSLASPPSQREWAEFYVQHVDDGLFTSRLWPLREGAHLWLDERVYGNFTLADVPTDADLVLVATGTGLGPYMSMVREFQGQARWRRCALVHSARTQADLGYREELEERARRGDSLQYFPTLTREPADSPWPGLRTRVQALLQPSRFRELAGWPLDPARTHVFLCGNPQMIAEVGEPLGAQGFRPHRRRAPGQLHSERYW